MGEGREETPNVSFNSALPSEEDVLRQFVWKELTVSPLSTTQPFPPPPLL
jgi:hypothetical protein